MRIVGTRINRTATFIHSGWPGFLHRSPRSEDGKKLKKSLDLRTWRGEKMPYFDIKVTIQVNLRNYWEYVLQESLNRSLEIQMRRREKGVTRSKRL